MKEISGMGRGGTGHMGDEKGLMCNAFPISPADLRAVRTFTSKGGPHVPALLRLLGEALARESGALPALSP